MRSYFGQRDYSDIKPWVIKAIEDESRKPGGALWEGAPSASDAYEERRRRVRFLRKCSKFKPRAIPVANRLDACEPTNRCLSGACPECGRLFQRWFVRRSRRFIAHSCNDPSGDKLVAISIVPTVPVIRPGQLIDFSISNLQRRLKWALNRANIEWALGGIDFSFNEDRDGKYKPFWSIYHYFVTTIDNEVEFKATLRKLFRPTKQVRRPIKISSFENNSRRRSYALKMRFGRRIGYNEMKIRNGTSRKCRNTSRDKLRAKERLELLIYRDQIGLAARVIFRGCKPVVNSSGVRIRRLDKPRRIKRFRKNRSRSHLEAL